MANINPNQFVLHSSDGKTKVTYSTTSLTGQATLNLEQAPAPIRHFSGSQVRRVNTEVGTLVSVTTRMTVDTGSTSFSVLIPAITLTGPGDHEKFSTEAIITTHRGPISVPATGVHESYQFIRLTGVASQIFTLQETAPAAQAATATK